jgi:hypothetical protein
VRYYEQATDSLLDGVPVSSLLKDSGVTATVIALLVFCAFEYTQHVGIPLTTNGALALAVYLFLIAMVLRSILKWFGKKETPPPA